jgi:H+/Cl- antiporter ClcA
MNKKKSFKELFRHETKKKVLKKFIVALLVFFIYFLFTIFHYGFQDGALISILTWSLFVFCTPLADAGFLLDFPLRLLSGIKMIYSEIIVWFIALIVNLICIAHCPLVYEKTFLLNLFKTILLNPFPFWLIILLSMAGTFLSIYFGDELLDVVTHKFRKKYNKHKKKHKLIWIIFIILLIILMYYYLLNYLGISFKI